MTLGRATFGLAGGEREIAQRLCNGVGKCHPGPNDTEPRQRYIVVSRGALGGTSGDAPT
jgi:hypothetical protein